MRRWQQCILAIAAMAAVYAIWRFPIHGTGVVVLTVGALWLGRSVYRTKLARNPRGDNRDFSIRPVMTMMVLAVSFFAAAILWSMLLAYAVRYKYLPDTWVTVGIVFVPALALLGLGAVFFVRAISRFQMGSEH